jgi:murein DD-endopeptidase MepM/ murein hydrolase activator NlpD
MIRSLISVAIFLSASALFAQVPTDVIHHFFSTHPEYYSDGFDFPVGKPDAKKYYNAQPFQKNNHLGDDWNGTGGGNSDLGDPVFSCANGYVVFAEDIGGGWGNVVRVVHVISEKPLVLVESLYAHLHEIKTKTGPIKRGGQLGTIGNAGGIYWAHLHLEIRTEHNMPIGGGYSDITTGYTDPTKFIKANRPVR